MRLTFCTGKTHIGAQLALRAYAETRLNWWSNSSQGAECKYLGIARVSDLAESFRLKGICCHALPTVVYWMSLYLESG